MFCPGQRSTRRTTGISDFIAPVGQTSTHLRQVQADERLADDLVAGAVAEAAEHALVRVVADGIGHFDDGTGVDFAGELLRFDVIAVRVVDETAVIVVMAAAVEAAGRFVLRLFFGESEVDGLEVVAAFLGSEAGHLLALLFLAVFEVGFGLFVLDEVGLLVADFIAGEVVVDAKRGLLSFADGFDGDAGATVGDVACREDVVDVGSEGHVVSDDGALLRELDAVHAVALRDLADGHEDVVDFDVFNGTFHRDRAASAGSIRFAQFHDLQLHAGDVAVLVCVDLGGVGEELEGDAFFLSLFDLDVRCGHLVAGTAIDDVDVFGAQSDRGTAAVHGGVAAAADGDVLAEERLLAEAELLEEVDAAFDAVEVFARDTHRDRGPCADGEEDCVVFVADVIELDVFAELDIVLQDDAGFLDDRDLLVEDCLRQTVLRNAVAEHTAHLRLLVKDGDRMAPLTQEVGSRQTGGAAADDGDFLAGVGFDGNDIGVFRQDFVRGEGLQERDGDGLFHQLPAAGVFTRMRADAADGGGDGEGFVDGLDRFLELAVLDLLDVLLAVGHGRAVQFARAAAVAGVVGEEQLEGGLPGADDTVGVGADHVALLRSRGTGTEQFRDAFDLDEADDAGTVDGGALVEAEGRDVDASADRGGEYGIRRLCNDFDTVEGIFDRHRSGLLSQCTSTAPKRQAVIQLPHLTQRSGSMVNGLLSSPVMASAGHWRAQAEQPTHLSLLML